MNRLKQLILLSFLSSIALTSCVTKRTTTSDRGAVEEKYIIKRPVKKFIQTVEFE